MERSRRRAAPAAGAGAASASSRGGVRLVQYAGFVPAILLYGLFFVAPLGLIVAYSFWQTVDYNVVHDWTLDNYRYFFSVPTYLDVLGHDLGLRRRDRDHDPDRVPVHLLARPLRAEELQGCCSCS